MKKRNAVLYTTRGAMVGALYVALTWLCSVLGLSSGVIQLRISEALCILPVFMPEAVPGLYIGCMLSNLIAGGNVWDVIFGSLATLIGSIGARAMRRLPRKLIWCATLPTVLANMLIVPMVIILAYGSEEAYWFIAATVGIGEAICAGIGGVALYYMLNGSGIFGNGKL
ncbi:MAG: QueT transporter family protein [Clostridia bacterium]|nr:QueT transporter family protein [Clostridia bacterium]